MNPTHTAKPVPVNATRILEVTDVTKRDATCDQSAPELLLRLEDGRNYEAGSSMTARFVPVPGDYLVTQEDGYEYLNPKDVFERKYTAVAHADQSTMPPCDGCPKAANLPDRDPSCAAEHQGLFRKFEVRRVDGSDQPGGKHHGCRYFVLDVDHDPHAADALSAYAKSCEATHPELARDLREQWGAKAQAADTHGTMPFGMAIQALKLGERVARAGWNGKGMWLAFVKADLAAKVAFQFSALDAAQWIGMKTADDKFVPWLASQTDVLAEDWVIVS